MQYTRDGKVKVRWSTKLKKFVALLILNPPLEFFQIIPEIKWNRFILSLIIFDLWNKNSIWNVSNKFNVARGTLHNFLMRTASFASSVQRFTEVRYEF